MLVAKLSRTPEVVAARLRGFREGLKEAGFVEGENVAIAYAWGEDQIERLPSLAVNLDMSGLGLLPCNLTPVPRFAGRKSLL